MCTVDSIHARRDALLKLQPGGSIVYHVGLLARDRDANFGTGAELAGAIDRLAKRHVTGKGNADKQAVIDAVRRLGFSPVDDNEADALALLNWAIAHGVGVVR